LYGLGGVFDIHKVSPYRSVVFVFVSVGGFALV
jgi:hypothetical protein